MVLPFYGHTEIVCCMSWALEQREGIFMGISVRLAVSLVTITVAYVLLVPRVPELRAWHAIHACPYLNQIREGLCARSLQVDKAAAPAPTPPAQIDAGAERPPSVAEQSAKVSGRLDGMSSDIDYIRQLQQTQDSALKEMEISLAKLHQTFLGVERTIDALRAEIERVRLGAKTPPETAAPAPTIPSAPARRPAQR